MPPTSLVNMLAFGLVGLVGAGLVILATYYNNVERPREENPYQNHRLRRRQPRKPANGRIVEPCFCGEDDRPTNCYLNICGHSFHSNCIRKWAQEVNADPTCPNCRETFNLQLDLKWQ